MSKEKRELITAEEYWDIWIKKHQSEYSFAGNVYCYGIIAAKFANDYAKLVGG